jgi:hypothetical protein
MSSVFVGTIAQLAKTRFASPVISQANCESLVKTDDYNKSAEFIHPFCPELRKKSQKKLCPVTHQSELGLFLQIQQAIGMLCDELI